jgi:transcriptional regulator with XRE-family HTH domain
MRGVKPPLSKGYKIRDDWFEKLLETTGITQPELEKRLRVSKQSISQWRNKRHFPSGKMFLVIMKEFGLRAELFLQKR